MKRIFLLPIAGLLFGCLPESEPRQIIVDGEATIEVDPDIFQITGYIRSRQSQKTATLREISVTLASIRDTAKTLEGLTNLNIEASEVNIQPVQEAICLKEREYRSEEVCPTESYFGTVSLKLTGSPANRSGYMLSLVSELGAESVRLSGYALTDQDGAKQAALEKAVENARAKAEKIASASSAMLSGPVRIQYEEGFRDPERYMYAEQMVSSPGPAVAESETTVPQTELDLDPQPIVIKEKVTAAFAIE